LEAKPTLEMSTVNDLLTKARAPRTFDFLSIDVEGLDEEVLAGLDFTRYHPRILLNESHLDVSAQLLSKSHARLEQAGYLFFAKTARTCFYLDKEWSAPC
jgi:hypothetical protein